MGAIHIFEKSPAPVPRTPASVTPEPEPEKPTTETDSKFLSPRVVGDEKFIDADPGDNLQDLFSELKPGDTLRLADGEYKTGPLKVQFSGKARKWIKIVAADNAQPKIDLLAKGDFQVSGSYIYLEGLEIYNGQKTNLRIASTTHTLSHVYVRKLKLRSLGVGPGSAIRIQRNNANGVGVSNIFIEDSDLSQSIPASVIDSIGANTVVLRNNFIHTDSGFAAGVTFKGGSSRILIENNFIKGVRKNPAIVLGGRTFLNFFDPQYPDQEGVEQIARNNIIVDFDESAVCFQGVNNAKFLHNTIITASNGPIFSFENGNTNDGSKPSKNNHLVIDNNLIVSRATATVYGSNNSGPIPSISFGKQMWIGDFSNAAHGRVSLPTFPLSSDTHLPSQKVWAAFENLQWKDVTDLETARVRFRPRTKGPLTHSTASIVDVPRDSTGIARSETTSFGALEN